MAQCKHKLLTPSDDSTTSLCGFVAFTSAADLTHTYESDAFLLENTHRLYLTGAASGTLPTNIKAEIIPCYRIWDWDADEVVAVGIYRRL